MTDTANPSTATGAAHIVAAVLVDDSEARS